MRDLAALYSLARPVLPAVLLADTLAAFAAVMGDTVADAAAFRDALQGTVEDAFPVWRSAQVLLASALVTEFGRRPEVIFGTVRTGGFTHVRAGSYRVCAFHPSGWLLKAPRTTAAFAANRHELARLAEATPAERAHLPETYDVGCGVLLQRVYARPHDVLAVRLAVARELAARLRVRDVRPANLALDEAGALRFIDFAPVLPADAFTPEESWAWGRWRAEVRRTVARGGEPPQVLRSAALAAASLARVAA
jgi:hypothetical protein